ALVVDPALPPSAPKLHAALCAEWPRLSRRVTFVEASLDDVDLASHDVVMSSHARGALTDRVIERAMAAQARVAVLPCCHELDHAEGRALRGWIDGALAIDVARAVRPESAGYRVWTQQLPAGITPQGRWLAGAPAAR